MSHHATAIAAAHVLTMFGALVAVGASMVAVWTAQKNSGASRPRGRDASRRLTPRP